MAIYILSIVNTRSTARPKRALASHAGLTLEEARSLASIYHALGYRSEDIRIEKYTQQEAA